MDVLKSRHRPQAKRMQADPLQVKRVQAAPPRVKQKPRSKSFGDLLVAPTGVDPVTFRFLSHCFDEFTRTSLGFVCSVFATILASLSFPDLRWNVRSKCGVLVRRINLH